MKRLRFLFNLFSFGLLALALYLNFVRKEPVGELASIGAAPVAGTAEKDQPQAPLQKTAPTAAMK